MFTGIVEELGTVTAFDRRGDTARLTIAAVIARDGSELGASVALMRTLEPSIDATVPSSSTMPVNIRKPPDRCGRRRRGGRRR